MSVTVTHVRKTKWEKIYSIFGFWKYYHYNNDGNKVITIYWCCFPFWYLRKFDLFSYVIK